MESRDEQKLRQPLINSRQSSLYNTPKTQGQPPANQENQVDSLYCIYLLIIADQSINNGFSDGIAADRNANFKESIPTTAQLHAEINAKNRIIYEMRLRDGWRFLEQNKSKNQSESQAENIQSLLLLKNEMSHAKEQVQTVQNNVNEMFGKHVIMESELNYLRTLVKNPALSHEIKDRRIFEQDVKLEETAGELSSLQGKVSTWARASKRNQDGRLQAEASLKVIQIDLLNSKQRAADNAIETQETRSLREENQSLRQQLETRLSKSQKMDSGLISKLETEIFDSKIQASNTIKMLDEANKKLYMYQQTIQEKNKEIETSLDEINSLNTELDLKKFEVYDLEMNMKELEDNNNSPSKSKDLTDKSNAAEINDLRNELENAILDLKRSQDNSKIEQQERDMILKDLQAAKQNESPDVSKDEIKALNETVNDLQDQVASCEHDLEMCSIQLEDRAEDVQILENRVITQKVTISELEKALEILNSSQTSSTKVLEMENQIKNLETELEDEIEKSKGPTPESENFKVTNEGLLDQVKYLEEQVNHHRERFASDDRSEKIKLLEDKIKGQTGVNSLLENQLEDAVLKINFLEPELQSLKVTNVDLSVQIEHLKEQVNNQRDQLASENHSEQIELLENKLDNQSEIISRLETQLEDLTTKGEAQETELKSLKAVKDEHLEQIKQFKSQIILQNQELEAANESDRIHLLEDKFEDQLDDISLLKQHLDDAVVKYKNQEPELQSLQLANEDLLEQFQHLKDQANQYRAQLDSDNQSEQIQLLQRKFEEKTGINSLLEHELEDAVVKVNTNEPKLKSFIIANDGLLEKIKRLEDQVKLQREQLDSENENKQIELLEHKLEDKDDSILLLKKQLEDVVVKLHSQEPELLSFKVANEGLLGQIQDLESFKSTNEGLLEQILLLKNQVDLQREQLASATDNEQAKLLENKLEDEMDEMSLLKQQFEGLVVKLKSKEFELQNLKLANEELLNAKLGVTQGKELSLLEEISNLQAIFREKEMASSHAQELSEEMEKLRLQITAAGNKNNQYQSMVAEIKTEASNSNAKVKDLRAQLEILENDDHKYAYLEAMDKIKFLEERLALLQTAKNNEIDSSSKIKELEEGFSSAQKSIRELQSQHSSMNAELDNSFKKLTKEEGVNSDLTQRINDISKKLTNAEDLNSDLMQKIADISQRLAKQDTKRMTMADPPVDIVQSLRDDLEKSFVKISELMHEKSQYSDELADLAEENEWFRNQRG